MPAATYGQRLTTSPRNRHVVSAVVSVGGSQPPYGAKVLLLVLIAHHVDHPTCRTLQPHRCSRPQENAYSVAPHRPAIPDLLRCCQRTNIPSRGLKAEAVSAVVMTGTGLIVFSIKRFGVALHGLGRGRDRVSRSDSVRLMRRREPWDQVLPECGTPNAPAPPEEPTLTQVPAPEATESETLKTVRTRRTTLPSLRRSHYAMSSLHLHHRAMDCRLAASQRGWGSLVCWR